MKNYKTAYSIISGLEVKAWECQVEKGTYQLPADSTFKKPLIAKDGHNVIYNNGKWNYKKIPEPPKPKAPTLAELKESKVLEAKQKRDFKLSNYSLKEGVLRTNNRAETFMILERYANNIDQNKILAEFGLENGVLVKLTKPIVDKWIGDIEGQYNNAWIDYRAVRKKIDNAKTISTLNKIEIK
jgi:hypothetical protein